MCFSHYLGVGGGGAPKGSRAQPAYAVFLPQQLKARNFSELDFFDTLTIQNDQISHVKNFLAPLSVFFTLFGCWVGGGGGGSQGGLGHNLLMQFSRLGSSKMEITSQRLLDQSQAGVYMGKTPHTPPFWPFWAYSRTLPQGVEMLV